MANYSSEDGVWRTIGGRRVFIRNGQSLSDAMKESGKFSRVAKNQELYKKVDEENKKIDEIVKKEETKIDIKEEKVPRAVGAKDFSDYGIGPMEEMSTDWEQEFSDYLRDKYGTDDIDIITTGSEHTANSLEDDFMKDYLSKKDKGTSKDNDLFQPDQSKLSDAYRTYRDKRDNFEGIERDELGNRNYDTMKDATWTGKEYTNEEFLANLEDENWHTERGMILDAGLTNKQMEFVKDHTTFHNGSPNLDTEITKELIKGAKGESYKTPEEIISARNKKEIESLQQELDIVSKGGRYDESGKKREGVKEFGSYDETKQRYKQLTGKDYDDSNVKIPYDPKKTYQYPNGVKIDQNLMKERYSGMDVEDIEHDIDFNKRYLMNYNPKDRELHNAEIKEMEKYVASQPKYKSRISDDFGTKDWEEGYGSYMGSPSWKGTKSDSGLYGKDKIKAIDDEIKKAYPDLKTSRKTGRGGYTDSFSYHILESDEPIVRDIKDFSDTEIERLWNKGYNRNYYKTKDEFKDHLKKELESGHFSVNEYNLKDDYALTPYGKQVFRDIMKVSNAYNYDESDSQTDYFNRGHYLDLYVGKDGKPYKANGTSKKASVPKSANEIMNEKIRNKGKSKKK